MFGKKKKELEAKKLAEQQPLPVEPEQEDFLDAEIILEDENTEGEMIDIDAVDDFAALNKTISIDPAVVATEEEPAVEEPIIEEPIVEEPIVEEALIDESPIEEPAAEEPAVEETPIEEPVEEEPVAEEAPTEEETEDLVEEPAEEADETLEASDEESASEASSNEDENNEEVVYVVDGPEEDDEIVKPAKLVKLPHLIDYMLMAEPKPSKRQLLKYATMLTEIYQKVKTPEDKAIVKGCVIKVANALRK